MKKQNTFKTRPLDIKYDPIPTKKEPLWMHSIDRPVRNRGEAWKAFAFFLLFFAALYIFVMYVYPNI